MPLLCRLKTGGQDRKALLHGTGGQRRNILRALSVALGSTAGLPAQRVQEVVNILCRNAAHHLITKVRQNVPVQIAAVAVVGVGRKALLSRVDGQPLLCKFPIGSRSIVLRSV